MEQRRYSQLQETLYYERMDNGLDVYVLPKPGFRKRTRPFPPNTARLTITSG